MSDPFDVVVLMGPPGAGKSYLGNRLAERGIATYLEIEPLIVEKFGRDVESRMLEVGDYIWRSYQQQLDGAEGAVVFESAGIADRPLHQFLEAKYRTALVLVSTARSVCVDRVVDRGSRKNISYSTDRDAIGRHYDLWHAEIAPTYQYALTVDGGDDEAAIASLQRLLQRVEAQEMG